LAATFSNRSRLLNKTGFECTCRESSLKGKTQYN
jgi:hypothetical protein